jgi:hypothetical protein
LERLEFKSLRRRYPVSRGDKFIRSFGPCAERGEFAEWASDAAVDGNEFETYIVPF